MPGAALNVDLSDESENDVEPIPVEDNPAVSGYELLPSDPMNDTVSDDEPEHDNLQTESVIDTVANAPPSLPLGDPVNKQFEEV